MEALTMKRFGALAAISIVVIVGALVAGCASIKGGNVSAYNIKDKVAVGTAAWRVLAVEKTKQTTSGAKANGVFVFVQMELKNTSNEAANLTGIEVELVDDANNVYTFDSQQNSTFLTSMGRDSLIKGRVEPGETVTGWVAFDIPETAKNVRMRVRDLDVTSSKSAMIDLKI
jgi:hypothetical protein